VQGLLIKSPHIENILQGRKSWEIRGSSTKNTNATIALIRGGSGTIVGRCQIASVIGPLTREQLLKNEHKHLVAAHQVDEVIKRYPKCYAWELVDVRSINPPVPYDHPSGAVIWVNLSPSTASRVGA
jgi:hypothetical protein